MSAKLLQALTEENPDLQRQIGCMTGIFQLFDRQHIVTGKRIHTHKRLPSGQSHLNSLNIGAEVISYSSQATPEKVLSKNPTENYRTSIESSRASFSSSSCSSSFSSLECNKTAQPEPPSSERASHGPRNSEFDQRPNSYSHSRQQFLNIRDAVKDSIYRETRGLSVRTPTKAQPVNYESKHRDSPRPLDLSRSMDGGTPKIPLDLNESLKVLAKLKDTPWYLTDAREPARSSCEDKDWSVCLISKEGPRFSYERELSRKSFDSREASKPAAKLRELPRLSLDSRERSMRNTNFDSKSNTIMRDLHSKELENCRRSTSVVAKLMGLEVMPNSGPFDQGQMDQKKTVMNEDQTLSRNEGNNNEFSRLSKMNEKSKQNRGSQSPKSSIKELVSSRARNSDIIMKPISSSRFPIEPAPWKQQESGRIPQKKNIRNRETSSQSVFSEIEKRLKDIDFKHSDKDLRALKQILDAMQAKGLLEKKKNENQISEFLVQKSYTSHNEAALSQNLGAAYKRSPLNARPISAPIKGKCSPRAFESPIVIMKPAKFIERSGVSASSVMHIDGGSSLPKSRAGDSVDARRVSVKGTGRDTPPKHSLREPGNYGPTSTEKRTSSKAEEISSPKPQARLSLSSSRTQQPSRESTTKSLGSGSSSPRLQQRKLDSDRRSRPPVSSSDSSKPRQQPIRQQTESNSPGGRRRPPKLGLKDDQMSDMSSKSRNPSHSGDDISMRSDSNVSLASQMGIEVTSADRSSEMVSTLKQEKSLSNLSKDGFLAELTTVAPEQPSPVSVLDPSFYQDDMLPSPVKNASNAFKGDLTFAEDGSNVLGVDQLPSNLYPKFSPEISHKKLENIEQIVEKLRQLNSNYDEGADHIASLSENTSPDHRYVSEILLASGLLLKDLESGPHPHQLHSPGHLINPDLFLVLEQTKVSWDSKAKHTNETAVHLKPIEEKLQRRLVFDTVNEILLRKLSVNQTEPWVQASKLTGVTTTGQQFLRELCSEIDQMHSESLEGRREDDGDGMRVILKENVICCGESWTEFHREVSGLVLDIERLIFKDLVDEMVNWEVIGLQPKQTGRRRRQLFSQ